MTDARSDIFPLMSRASKPGRLVSTRKPRTPSSVCAQITASCASVPFVIQRFVPFSTQPLPFRTARVRMPETWLPKSGSVRPKQPIARPDTSSGSQRSFCASLPYVWIGYITSPPCTDANERSPESPRSSSCITRPYATLLIPAQP